jgi:aerobic carbon-monoxide dehydrogenase medium subunit
MKPPKFDYFAPTDIADALALIAEHGEDSRFLAGGQSLVPMLNFRVAAPSALIDLNRVTELQQIRVGDSGDLHLGAMTRTRQIECDPAIGAANPLLQAVASHIAHVQIRNRGTIGGSLAHADPAAELPGIVLVCDAQLHIAGPTGKRVVPADAFFESVFSTALADGELLTEIVFPAWPAARCWAFQEVSRREGDFAMVGIAAWFDTDDGNRITKARLAAIGAGDTPLRLPSAEAVLAGNIADAALFADAAQAGIEDLQPGSDIHASAEYRREVGGVLIGRVLTQAWERH